MVNLQLEMAADDEHDKTKKKKRIKKRSKETSWQLPTAIVCSPAHVASQPGAMEAGVILTLLVIGLYLYGCYEAMLALPETDLSPDWTAHQGENVVISNLHFDPVSMASAVTDNKNAVSKLTTNSAVSSKPVSVPAAKWPVSIREEDESTYDTIIHPGDNKTEMKVPKFWSKPIHNGQLMSRETAMKVGSCIEPDANGNYNRGDECPPEKRTIYVSIASYRDFECRSTVESIFGRAKYPERVRVGVVDQIVNGEDVLCNDPIQSCDEEPDQALCKYKDQVDVYEMAAQLSIGPVFARHIGYRLYRGEYYATQSDAHVTYTTDWDVDIIEQFQAANNEMAVLSTYLTDVQGSIGEHGESIRHTRPIMCNTRYEGGPQGMHLRHGSQPERRPSMHGMPQLQPWWAAGYSFSRGHFIVNVPYDWLSPMIFQGEEMSIGIRGFTIGYDFYAPERSVCFHHYATGENARIRNKVHHFWENDNKYAGTGKPAMSRLLGIVHMNPEVDPKTWDHVDLDLYGLGGVRTPEKFYETFGIDVVNKQVEGHLCKFVDKLVDGAGMPRGENMHHMFTPFLRKDGMGIDYTNIDYKFKDPAPNEK